MTEREKIRKLRHNLYIGGIGVILFGLWGCMKAVMTLYLSEDVIVPSTIEPEYIHLYQVILFIMVLILTAIIMAFHLYVGLNAIKAGKKGNQKKKYLFVAVFMALLSIASIIGDISIARDDLKQIDIAITAVLVDSMFIFIIFDIIYSSAKIKTLENGLVTEKEL